MTANWHIGNAAEEGSTNRGWLIGHFMEPGDIRATNDVEVKWGVHPAGDKRAQWTSDDQRTTVVLLVHGNFRVDLTGGSATMTNQGDYVMWGPGVDHSWEALEHSTVITVRWPSKT